MTLDMPEGMSSSAWKMRLAGLEDLPLIRGIVEVAWPVAFGEIVSAEFLKHELQRCYSNDALSALMADGEQFILAYESEELLGFTSWRLVSPLPETTGLESAALGEDLSAKLEKLYLKPNLKGKGYGKALILQVMAEATNAGAQRLSLNVNRKNPAVQFYERMGFAIVKSEDIEVGPGFYRNDYVMSRTLP